MNNDSAIPSITRKEFGQDTERSYKEPTDDGSHVAALAGDKALPQNLGISAVQRNLLGGMDKAEIRQYLSERDRDDVLSSLLPQATARTYFDIEHNRRHYVKFTVPVDPQSIASLSDDKSIRKTEERALIEATHPALSPFLEKVHHKGLPLVNIDVNLAQPSPHLSFTIPADCLVPSSVLGIRHEAHKAAHALEGKAAIEKIADPAFTNALRSKKFPPEAISGIVAKRLEQDVFLAAARPEIDRFVTALNDEIKAAKAPVRVIAK